MLKEFINQLPKAELHIHLSGTLEPSQFLYFAQRNKISLPYTTLEQAQELYKFDSFDQFFNNFKTITSVLQTGEDFHDLTLAYLKKAVEQNVIHIEPFFSTQGYTEHPTLNAESIMEGIQEALNYGEKTYKITSYLILCFLRNLSEKSAFETFNKMILYKNKIVAIGLAGPEKDNPPEKFSSIYKYAKQQGFKTTAHTGEEYGPLSIREALRYLNLDRIDHGVRCWEDPTLVKELVEKQIPLTICPLSNKMLKLYPNLSDHPFKKMLAAGLLVSINSDDPPYFGGYLNENYQALADSLELTKSDLIICAKNSIISSFADDTTKKKYIEYIDKIASK